MAKMTKAPTVNIKPPPAPKAPPPNFSKTQDNFSHHTSPNKGPQGMRYLCPTLRYAEEQRANDERRTRGNKVRHRQEIW